ncbi:MAG: LysM peptidoglycan-binding domain-containing protein [Chitinophagaceae bacterium]|nr:LysM peptidoglycan-binding domain-containing protein [Chitinophagaceae bacterium]
MPDRSFISSEYQRGFQGFEKNDDIKGAGNSYTTAFREYDPRVGRWWSVDPLTNDYPWQSPYVGFDNNPIRVIDPTGQGGEDPQAYIVQKGNTLSQIAKDNGTTINDIMALNKDAIKNADNIFAGQTINIPGSSSSSSASNRATTISNTNTLNVSKINESKSPNSSLPVKSINAQEQQGSMLGLPTEWIGPTMYLLGQPLDILKSTAPLASNTGSSVLSWSMSRVWPNQSPTLGKFQSNLWKKTSAVIGKQTAKEVVGGSSAVVGRVLGRWASSAASGIGLALTVYDFTAEVAIPMSQGVSDYSNTYKDAGLIYHICFEKGTLVYANKGLVAIESIQIGDSVYTYNIQTNEIEESKVLNTLERNTGEIYEITTIDQTIFVTAEHPFYIEGKGWVTVKQLKVGDKFKTMNSKTVEQVKSLSLLQQSLTVYNIEVDGNHNYFVTSSSILVHNKGIHPVKELKKFKEKIKIIK